MSETKLEYQIGGKIISENNAFIIAEVGSNHGQDLDVAIKYIEDAADCGVDAVKFQFFDADDLVPNDHPARAEVESYVTPIEWIPKLQEICSKSQVVFFASTFNSRLFQIVENSDVPLHKIASSEVLNPSMLLAAGRTNKPILISFGMSEWYEVELAMKILAETGNSKIIPLHCIAKYPLPLESANLLVIQQLKKRFGGIIGFSDHTESVEIGGWAAMLGARVFEKHFTLDKTLNGADHGYALESAELKMYVENIRQSLVSLGTGEKTYLKEELNGRRRLGARATFSSVKGESVKELKLEFSRPRTEVPANLIDLVKDLKLVSNLESGSGLKWKDLE
jgi:sialic acid synthase SpsE